MSRLPKADPEHCQALTLGETQNLHRFGGVLRSLLGRGGSRVTFKVGFRL